ncbi:hypothetical protein, partial [Macrococcoides bohemicum]|uniref:hypothetical protein n=1 Tax=Macrococcoides bohemicum TaxID=1903056 RepID=UPI00289CF14E
LARFSDFLADIFDLSAIILDLARFSDFLADIFDLSAIISGFDPFFGFHGRYFRFIGHHFEVWPFFRISWPINLHKKILPPNGESIPNY